MPRCSRGRVPASAPQAARAHITNLWRQSDTGASFAKALEDSGWILARGDRRDFVAVDPKGGVHSLARRIEGAKVRDVRARLVNLDPSALPSVAEARAMQRARQRARAPQEAARMPPSASGRRPAPRPARVVTSGMRRALATRLARLARRPAALPIPRSAAPAHVAGDEVPTGTGGGRTVHSGQHRQPRQPKGSAGARRRSAHGLAPRLGSSPRPRLAESVTRPRCPFTAGHLADREAVEIQTGEGQKAETHFRRVATSTVADRGLWPRHRSGSQGEGRAALDRADASARDRRHVPRAAHGLAGSHCRQDHMGGI